VPSLFLIVEHIPQQEQRNVYGALFSWLDLLWAFAYPIAGITGKWFQLTEFLIGSAIEVFVFILVCLVLLPNKKSHIFFFSHKI
jgi:MFS transporter, NRE family, putaive nickel resistance protein